MRGQGCRCQGQVSVEDYSETRTWQPAVYVADWSRMSEASWNRFSEEEETLPSCESRVEARKPGAGVGGEVGQAWVCCKWARKSLLWDWF
jgi:hypothetical protein